MNNLSGIQIAVLNINMAVDPYSLQWIPIIGWTEVGAKLFVQFELNTTILLGKFLHLDLVVTHVANGITEVMTRCSNSSRLPCKRYPGGMVLPKEFAKTTILTPGRS
jgi:hypothetical protein